MTSAAQRAQIDANYDYLQRTLALLLPEHEGQYALLKDCRIVGFFDRPSADFDAIAGMDVLSRCDVLLDRSGRCRLQFGWTDRLRSATSAPRRVSTRDRGTRHGDRRVL